MEVTVLHCSHKLLHSHTSLVSTHGKHRDTCCEGCSCHQLETDALHAVNRSILSRHLLYLCEAACGRSNQCTSQRLPDKTLQ